MASIINFLICLKHVPLINNVIVERITIVLIQISKDRPKILSNIVVTSLEN